MKLILSSLLFFMVLLSSLLALAVESQLEIPPEAEITPADQAAVELLGEKRGALELIPEIRNIEGLEPVETVGKAVQSK